MGKNHLHFLRQLGHGPGNISSTKANCSEAEAGKDNSGTHGSEILTFRLATVMLMRGKTMLGDQDHVKSLYLTRLLFLFGEVQKRVENKIKKLKLSFSSLCVGEKGGNSQARDS